jgi:PAS domain S-box-containing protein
MQVNGVSVIAQDERLSPHTGWSSRRTILAAAAVAAVYFAVGAWSLRFSVVADGASLVWVPSGLALAAVLLWGPRLLPGVFLGALLVNTLATEHGLVVPSLAFAAGNTLEALLGWWLLRRVMGFNPRIVRASDGVALAFVGTPVAPLPGAAVGAAMVCAAGLSPWSEFWSVFAVWYIGDAISILLISPMLLGWVTQPRITWRGAIEGVVVGLLVVLTALVAFGRESSGTGSEYPLAFIPLPLVVWGAMRLGPRGAATLSLLLCIVCAWATMSGRGPFDTRNFHDSIRLLWAFMAVVAGTALCLSAASRESRIAVATLRQSRERYRLLLEGSGVIAWEYDPATARFTYVTARAEALLGYPLPDWYTPLFWERVVHPEDVAAAKSFCAQRTAQGLDHAFDYRMLSADGRTVWIHDIVTVIRRENGDVQLRGVMIDVTDRKLAQEELALAERKFRTLFEQSPYGVWIADPESGAIIDANAAVCELLGEFDAGEGPTGIQEHIARIGGDGGDVFETRLRRADGATFDAQLGVRIARVGGKAVVNAIIRDITAQKRAVATIRASEQRFRAMFERHDAIMVLIDQETGSFIDANAAAAAFYGYSREQLRAMRITDVNTAPREEVRAAMSDARAGGRNRFEFRHRLADGRERLVEVHSSPLDYAGRTLLFSIIHDITEQRQAQEERDRLQGRVLHAQKLESLGVLAGGIAHDFNNLLVGILGNTGIAMQGLPAGSPAAPVLRTVEQAAQRAADLTRQLLAYAGKGRLSVEPLCLSDLVMDVAQLVDMSIAPTAEVVFDLPPGTPRIEGDATQIRQVAMNLLTNASDALEGRPGRIRVRTGVFHADREYLESSFVPSHEPAGDYAFLEVADNGIGMDQQTLTRIFDPFFTTKFTGRGLGLAAALGIIRGHRGAIKVSSQPGKGTTIRVLFPVVESSEAAATGSASLSEAKPLPTALPDRPGGTILVVDDEKFVRDMVVMALRAAGYSTIAAEDGDAAIEALRTHSAGVSAVVLDMTMPGMSGPAVMHRMRELGLSVPVVLSSGYAEQDVLDGLGDATPAAFLQKPYTNTDLVRTVARVARARVVGV